MKPSRPHPRWSLKQVDRSMLVVAVANFLFALGVGWRFGQGERAFGLALACLLPAVIGYVTLAGRRTCALPLAGSIAALVMLQIHLSYGMIEFHFNVFVSISLLLAYRDWRPIVFMGTLFLAHHLAFDRLLALGYGVYCMSEPDLGRVLLHGAFVTVQCAYLTRVALVMQRHTKEARELEFLVHAMGQDGAIRLDLGVIRAETAAGRRLKHVQDRMAELLSQVQQVGASLGRASHTAANSGDELMSRTGATASGLKDAAVCLEQIGIIVQHSTEAAAEARQMSDQAAEVARRGGTLVADVVRTMQAMEEASGRITEIIGVIDGIAFQTNILALNAAVEAARAGEQGRGFAVVAAEVRALSQRTTGAAREIKGLIGNSVSTVAEGTRLVAGAGETMTELVSTVQRVGELFQNITADASDHAQGLQVVNASMTELSALTEQNVAVAEQARRTAAELDDQVLRLNECLAAFRLEEVAGHQEAPPRPARLPASSSAPAAPALNAAPRTTGPAAVEFF